MLVPEMASQLPVLQLAATCCRIHVASKKHCILRRDVGLSIAPFLQFPKESTCRSRTIQHCTTYFALLMCQMCFVLYIFVGVLLNSEVTPEIQYDPVGHQCHEALTSTLIMLRPWKTFLKLRSLSEECNSEWGFPGLLLCFSAIVDSSENTLFNSWDANRPFAMK